MPRIRLVATVVFSVEPATSLLRAQVFRLAVVLLYTAGLRRGEVVRLVLSDYDPVERTLLVRASKSPRSLGLPVRPLGL
jgi:integrase/recombinase XerD